jgi:hypothetical protein
MLRHPLLPILSVFTLALAACGDSVDTGADAGPQDGGAACFNVSGQVAVGPVQVERPRDDTKACNETPQPPDKTICAEVAADFSCAGNALAPSTPASVTARGCLVAFGIDVPTTSEITVALFREFEPDGDPVDPGYDVDGAPGQQANNSPGAFLGAQVTQAVERTRCADEGYYEIAGIPTETPLIIRVTEQQLGKTERIQVDTYQYNVLLRNADVKDANGDPVADVSTCTPTTCFVELEANTISNATFLTTATTAGVSSIPGSDDLYDGAGQGHIAGRVRDCNYRTVQHATVGLDVTARKLAYFNVDFGDSNAWNFDNPRPFASRRSTNADGLYSAIGIEAPPGGRAVTIGAAITPSVCGADGVCPCTELNTPNPAWSAADTGEGETIPLGFRVAYVFPDSVTLLSFDSKTYAE